MRNQTSNLLATILLCCGSSSIKFYLPPVTGSAAMGWTSYPLSDQPSVLGRIPFGATSV